MDHAFLRRTAIYKGFGERLRSDARFVQVIIGPRQVGKTTTLRRYLEEEHGSNFLYFTADSPTPPSASWIVERWNEARAKARSAPKGAGPLILALDEIQKIPRWSEAVKACFDEDRYRRTPIAPVLLGSSALLVGRGLSESLAGRFELIRFPHWSFSECRQTFGASLMEYLYFGGYPAGYALRADPDRWRAFVADSIIEAAINRDLLALTPVDKPALFRQVFALVCAYPAQVVAYQKLLGQLADAGNATTVANYIQALSNAFLVAPMSKWSDKKIRQRASSPKIVLLNNALVSAMDGRGPGEIRASADSMGHILENAIGAHLVNSGLETFYWRDRDLEADFVVRVNGGPVAIEVTAGQKASTKKGLDAFTRRVKQSRSVRIGGKGADFDAEQFLLGDPRELLG